MMTFYDWMIARYQGKNSPSGDLADDMSSDKAWPAENTRAAIQDHLNNHDACSECVEVFKRCWRDYRKNEEVSP